MKSAITIFSIIKPWSINQSLLIPPTVHHQESQGFIHRRGSLQSAPFKFYTQKMPVSQILSFSLIEFSWVTVINYCRCSTHWWHLTPHGEIMCETQHDVIMKATWEEKAATGTRTNSSRERQHAVSTTSTDRNRLRPWTDCTPHCVHCTPGPLVSQTHTETLT